MRLPIAVRLALPLTLLAALAGCGHDNPVSSRTTTLDTRTQVLTALTQTPGVIEDGLSDSEQEASFSVTSGLAAIRPLAFRRTFSGRERTFEFAYADSDSTGRPARAVVTIRTRLTGTLHILAGADSTTDAHRVSKPIDELRVRRIALRRARLPFDVPRDADVDQHDSTTIRWRIAGVSGADVRSRNHTVTLVSVHIRSGALDTTLTDPLALVRLRRLPSLPAGELATVTVTTTHADDVVLLHPNDRRIRLTANGDNTYTGTFRTPRFARGLWHFAIDALAHDTLFDDQAPYDSNRWVFPYVIAPNQLDGPTL